MNTRYRIVIREGSRNEDSVEFEIAGTLSLQTGWLIVLDSQDRKPIWAVPADNVNFTELLTD